MTPLYVVLDQYKLTRRITLAFTLFLTWSAFEACVVLANAGKDALVLGAIMGPVSVLQGAVFKFYGDQSKGV